MAARKFKKSWWTDFRFNGIRYRRRSPENSRAGARAYEVLLRRKLARGESIATDKESRTKELKFRNYASFWFENYVMIKNKRSEIESKRSILSAHLLPFFGPTLISRISSKQIDKYIAHKANQGLSNKTINNHLTVLSKCLRTAQDWGDLEKMPKIERQDVRPPETDFLTVEESVSLLNYADGIWHDMFLLILKTGLRLGELRAMEWSDINWHSRILTVRRSYCRGRLDSPKSNKIRHIPLHDEVLAVLKKRKKDEGFIFTDKSGRILSNGTLYRGIKRNCRKASLREIGWHTLRHTFASHLAMAGGSLKAIKELLGHSDIQTTMRYLHLAPSALKETIDLLKYHHSSSNYGQPADNRNKNLTKTVEIIASDNPLLLAKGKQNRPPKGLLGSVSG